MEPFHQALGLRVGRLADDHLRTQGAAERLAVAGELDDQLCELRAIGEGVELFLDRVEGLAERFQDRENK